MGNVIFYSCTDSNNKLNKTLTEIKTVTANFKGNVSETDPIIFVNSFDFSNVNYMYISDFNRYYFVKDIVAVPGGLHVSGHVDVLMSFKDEINNIGAIVSRSSNYSNPDIIDHNMKTTQYKNFNIIESNKSFSQTMSHYIVVAG